MDKPDSISRAAACLWACMSVYLLVMAISFIAAPNLSPTAYFFSPLCAGLTAAGVNRGNRIAAKVVNVLGSVYSVISVVVCLLAGGQWFQTGSGEAFFWFIVDSVLSGLWITSVWMLNREESKGFLRHRTEMGSARDVSRKSHTTISCPFCRTQFEELPDLINGGVNCPSCGKRFVVRSDNHVMWSKQRIVGIAIAVVIVLAMGAGYLAGTWKSSNKDVEESELVDCTEPSREVFEDSLAVLERDSPDAKKRPPVLNNREESQHVILPDLTATRKNEWDPFVLSSCVVVETLTSHGSGLLYQLPNGNLYIITCRHVIEDGYFVIVRDTNGRIIDLDVEKGKFELFQNIKAFVAKDRDLALIQVKRPNNEKGNLTWMKQ